MRFWQPLPNTQPLDQLIHADSDTPADGRIALGKQESATD